MSKVRINDLARELEVKSKAILDVLPLVGVTEKKTHSSSIEADEAERVRKHLSGQGAASAARDGGSRSTASKKSPIRLATSSAGRDQFSLENANRVSASTPSRLHSSTQRRTGVRPAL